MDEGVRALHHAPNLLVAEPARVVLAIAEEDHQGSLGRTRQEERREEGIVSGSSAPGPKPQKGSAGL